MSDISVNHLGIIMDGNGRWAINKNQPRVYGHKQGAKTAKMIIDYCAKKEIPFLTLYTFSNENWSRPKEEINSLMDLLSFYLEKEVENMMRNNIRFNVVGRIESLPKKTRNFVLSTMNKTKKPTMICIICVLNSLS